jgi:hypothetical protein
MHRGSRRGSPGGYAGGGTSADGRTHAPRAPVGCSSRNRARCRGGRSALKLGSHVMVGSPSGRFSRAHAMSIDAVGSAPASSRSRIAAPPPCKQNTARHHGLCRDHPRHRRTHPRPGEPRWRTAPGPETQSAVAFSPRHRRPQGRHPESGWHSGSAGTSGLPRPRRQPHSAPSSVLHDPAWRKCRPGGRRRRRRG